MKGVARIGVVAGVMVLCLTACGESRNSVSSEITSAISQPAEVSTEYFKSFRNIMKLLNILLKRSKYSRET